MPVLLRTMSLPPCVAGAMPLGFVKETTCRLYFCCAAGVTSTIALFPLETVRTRIAVHYNMYRGIGDCFKTIIAKEGPKGLYQVICCFNNKRLQHSRHWCRPGSRCNSPTRLTMLAIDFVTMLL